MVARDTVNGLYGSAVYVGGCRICIKILLFLINRGLTNMYTLIRIKSLKNLLVHKSESGCHSLRKIWYDVTVLINYIITAKIFE